MTAIIPAEPYPAQPAADTHLRFGGVLRSEWIKLRSLRSTVWSYLIVIALSLGMSLIMSLSVVNGWNGGADASAAPAEQQTQLVLQSSVFGVYFGQLVVAVLGVLVIGGEHTTGMIRSTLAAVPTRLPVLASKAVVLFAATFVVGTLSALGAFLTASIVMADHGISASITEPDVVLTLLGGALYLALIAVFALGVGTMLRSSAGGIAVVLGLLLLLPAVLQMIPADWAHDLIPYLLSSAGISAFIGAASSEEIVEGPNAWQSSLIVLAWVGASIGGGAVLLHQRDA